MKNNIEKCSMIIMSSMMGDYILGALQMEPTSILKQIRLTGLKIEKFLEPKVLNIQKNIFKITL
jgi:hypothetical protein